ncbi:hypothetical protein ACWDTG_06810 [Rhodococcus zopfii]
MNEPKLCTFCDLPAGHDGIHGYATPPSRAATFETIVETLKLTGGAVEIGGVRIELCDEYGATDTTKRAAKAADAIDSIREYAQLLRAMATEVRQLDAVYQARVYDDIATTLERKIGDRT